MSLGGMFGDMQSGVCARSAQQCSPRSEAEGRSIPERDTGTLPNRYRLSPSFLRQSRAPKKREMGESMRRRPLV